MSRGLAKRVLLSDTHTSAAARPARPGASRGPQPNGEDPTYEGEIDFSHYSRTLVRHWKLLVTTAVAGLAIGLTVASMRPTLYEASSTILLGNATAPGAGPTSRALLANQSLAARMLSEVGLDRPPAGWTPNRFVDEALRVEEVPGTALVRVKVKLGDPVKAADASRVLSREAVALNRRIATDQSSSLREDLGRHLGESTKRFEAAEQALLTYRNEAQLDVLRRDAQAKLDERGTLLKLLIDIETEKARVASAEKEIEKQDRVLPAARAVRSEESLRRAAKGAQNAAPVPLPGTADPEALDLSQPFMNPVYQTLALQISTSRARLAGLERQRGEMSARKIADKQFAELSELYRRELEMGRLEGTYELAKTVHADLSLRYEQSRTEPVINMVQLQIVDEAVPPDRPLSKKRAQSALLGLVAGLLVGTTLALAWATLAGSVRPAAG